MTRFLYWNTNRKPLTSTVRTLARAHEVDVLILSEFPSSPASMLQSLNAGARPDFQFAFGLCERIRIFTRFSSSFLKALYEDDRVSIRHLALPAQRQILIVAVHQPSKLFWSEDSQAFECTELSRTVIEQETKVGHRNTILVGDLNMNPFEKGLVSADGLNAVSSRRVASRGSKRVRSRQYPFFFNPMWAHFGERTGHPAGSYYYERAELVNYYWNIFDQVLVRPDIMDRCDGDGIRILTKAGDASLLRDNGTPDSERFSDHLPLMFEIELREES
ncbi:MAG TPA: endonuclease/exonuclease/phosphatase family protein [Terriglobia bacterium]|nr:endonuclease/exonuclease/phosphatase family protein [Terriglobia bacterium]